MLRPASKPADMYNYRVAAYLKTFVKDLKIPGLTLENLDFSVIPKPIPKENSFLGVEILFDIVISGSELEYLCECKYHQAPRPLSSNMTEVKDSLLEFVAAEKYRINSTRRDGITYLLITNCSTTGLAKELDHLKTGSDSEVSKYCETLAKRAPQKWKNLENGIEIKIEWIRSALTRTMLLEIDDGRLGESSKNVVYEQQFREMMDRISRTNPSLVPLEYRVRNTIRFNTGEDGEDTVDIKKGGYFLEISREAVNQILTRGWTGGSHFVRADYHELPFVKNCEILHHSSISTERSMELIIETLNDIIVQPLERPVYFITINPGTYEVYFANLEWFYKLASSNVSARGLYELGKIARELPMKVSRFVLENLVKESMRLKANTIVRQDLMDFQGIEEADCLY